MDAPIYVYDGECVLCSRAVQYVLRHDHQEPLIRFVAIGSAEGRRISKAHKVDPNNPHTFIYIENGRAYFLSDGIFAMLRRVGGWGRIALLFQWVPRPIRDWVYQRISRNRYNLFGRLKHCYVPSPETRQRFVLETDPE